MLRVTHEKRKAAGEGLDCLEHNGAMLLQAWEGYDPDESVVDWAADIRDRIEEIRETLEIVESVVRSDLYNNIYGRK